MPTVCAPPRICFRISTGRQKLDLFATYRDIAGGVYEYHNNRELSRKGTRGLLTIPGEVWIEITF